MMAITLIFASLFALVTPGQAGCASFDELIQRRVADYLMAKYKIPATASLTLKENVLLEGSCIRRLTYEATAPKRSITIFLTPDQKYLTPFIYDLAEDPLIEEKERAKQLAKTLTADEEFPRGNSDAPVTIVEFSDFQCPFCKQVSDILKKEFLSSNRYSVRILYKNLPLPNHAWAAAAAEAAVCAGFQDASAFWQLHDFIFENQAVMNANNIQDRVLAFVKTQTKLDPAQFGVCVKNRMAQGVVMRDSELARSVGVRGTPTLFINGVEVRGATTTEELRRLVELAASGKLMSGEEPQVSSQNRSEGGTVKR